MANSINVPLSLSRHGMEAHVFWPGLLPWRFLVHSVFSRVEILANYYQERSFFFGIRSQNPGAAPSDRHSRFPKMVFSRRLRIGIPDGIQRFVFDYGLYTTATMKDTVGW
jgi:hypothetical protein